MQLISALNPHLQIILCWLQAEVKRQISALRDEIDDEFAKANIELKGIEGQPSSGWILMDFGDIIVNFTYCRDASTVQY